MHTKLEQGHEQQNRQALLTMGPVVEWLQIMTDLKAAPRRSFEWGSWPVHNLKART